MISTCDWRHVLASLTVCWNDSRVGRQHDERSADCGRGAHKPVSSLQQRWQIPGAGASAHGRCLNADGAPMAGTICRPAKRPSTIATPNRYVYYLGCKKRTEPWHPAVAATVSGISASAPKLHEMHRVNIGKRFQKYTHTYSAARNSRNRNRAETAFDSIATFPGRGFRVPDALVIFGRDVLGALVESTRRMVLTGSGS